MTRAIATCLYVGLMRPAPGTWGSAAAVLLACALHGLGSFPLLVIATLAVTPLGWWATAVQTRGRDDHDPKEIVIDEVAGQWLALWPVSFGMWQMGSQSWAMPWQFLLAAFLLFRLFDITKPGPVGWADRRHDALGVMLDDVIAGALAALVLFLGLKWQHLILGGVEWFQTTF